MRRGNMIWLFGVGALLCAACGTKSQKASTEPVQVSNQMASQESTEAGSEETAKESVESDKKTESEEEKTESEVKIEPEEKKESEEEREDTKPEKEESLEIRKEVMEYARMSYGDFLANGGKEASNFFVRMYRSPAYNLDAQVVLESRPENDSGLETQDVVKRVQGKLGKLMSGMKGSMTQEQFLAELKRSYKLDAKLFEDKESEYFLSNRYLHIIATPMQDKVETVMIDVDLSGSEMIDADSDAWVRFPVKKSNWEEDSEIATRFEQDERMYKKILDGYDHLISEPFDMDAELQPEYVYSMIHPYWLEYTEEGACGEGFTFRDLNEDGIDELLLGWAIGDSWDMDYGYVFAIFTMVDGKPVLAVEGWDRNRYVIGEDGFIYNCGSSGASFTTYFKYRFNPDKENFLEPIEEIYSQDAPGLGYWWEHITNLDDIGVIEYQEKHDDLLIEFDEVDKIVDSWIQSSAQLKYKIFSDYEP